MYNMKKRKLEKITKTHVQPLELIYLQLQQLILKVAKLEKIVDKLEKIVDKLDKKCESNSKHKMQPDKTSQNSRIY